LKAAFQYPVLFAEKRINGEDIFIIQG